MSAPLAELSDRDLQRKADGLRNRRDCYRHGSPHADEFVQELARVTREQERRRDHRTRTAALGIEELELGVRAYNILKRMGVDYLGQLARVDKARLDEWDRENPDKACGTRTRADILEARCMALDAIKPKPPEPPEVFTFGVYPTALDDSFDSFLLEVPTLSGQDAAARRAWWQAFHLLGPRGIDPEEFSVCEWITGDGGDGMPGRLVTSGGLTGLLHVPRFECSPDESAGQAEEFAHGLGEIDAGGA